MFNGFHLALPTPVCTPQAEASRRSQQNPRRVQNTGKTHDFQKTFLTGGLHVDELKKNIILSEHPVLSGRSKTLQGRMPRTFPIASFYLIGKAGATTLSSIPSRKQSTTGNHLLDVWPKLSIPQSAHKKIGEFFYRLKPTNRMALLEGEAASFFHRILCSGTHGRAAGPGQRAPAAMRGTVVG